MLRVMGILKVRDDDYDARMREIQITDDGIACWIRSPPNSGGVRRRRVERMRLTDAEE